MRVEGRVSPNQDEPTFEEIELDITSGWIEEQRTESKRRVFDTIKARYKVVLPDTHAVDGMMAVTTEAEEAP